MRTHGPFPKAKSGIFKFLSLSEGRGRILRERPLLAGFNNQGRTVDEALSDIREVIELIAEEKKNREALELYHPRELSLPTIEVDTVNSRRGLGLGPG